MRAGLANRAVRFGEQLWKSVPADYALELAPRELLDLLYPLPYREPLLMHAPPRGVDPRLVLSIARQESRFQPDAKSVAAARGLMQFIPETSNDIARQLALSDFMQDHLYNPDTAILFSSQYLANLFKLFPAQPEAVAAAYNGGPENVARWIGRSRSNEAERYVPELGFSQTKDYVFKVMTNFCRRLRRPTGHPSAGADRRGRGPPRDRGARRPGHVRGGDDETPAAPTTTIAEITTTTRARTGPVAPLTGLPVTDPDALHAARRWR